MLRLSLTLLFCNLLIHGECIKWTLFSVPSWVKLGEGASLTCKFDLEGQNLYAVKWYKDGREIYRYVPAEKLTQQDFPMAGVNIDVSQSDKEVVRLRNVSLESTGRYKCEVLAESPKFMTLVKSGEMQVVDLPAGPPIVLGGQSEYEDGDLVNVTCITLPSMPPAQVTWYINGHEAPNDILYPHSTVAPLPQSPQHYPNNQYPFNQYPSNRYQENHYMHQHPDTSQGTSGRDWYRDRRSSHSTHNFRNGNLSNKTFVNESTEAKRDPAANINGSIIYVRPNNDTTEALLTFKILVEDADKNITSNAYVNRINITYEKEGFSTDSKFVHDYEGFDSSDITKSNESYIDEKTQVFYKVPIIVNDSRSHVSSKLYKSNLTKLRIKLHRRRTITRVSRTQRDYDTYGQPRYATRKNMDPLYQSGLEFSNEKFSRDNDPYSFPSSHSTSLAKPPYLIPDFGDTEHEECCDTERNNHEQNSHRNNHEHSSHRENHAKGSHNNNLAGNSVGSARSSDHLQQSQPSLSHSRQSVKVTLAFTVRRYHFDRGNMTLRCEARVSELYTGQEELHARRKTTIRPALFGGRTSGASSTSHGIMLSVMPAILSAYAVLDSIV